MPGIRFGSPTGVRPHSAEALSQDLLWRHLEDTGATLYARKTKLVANVTRMGVKSTGTEHGFTDDVQSLW